MRATMAASGAALMMLITGCSDTGSEGAAAGADGGTIAASSKPIDRQPGSWSTKMEVVKMEGPDVKPGDKEQMQAMMGMMSGISVCLTPEAASQEDIAEKLEKLGSSGGECTFGKRDISGNRVMFEAQCKGENGGTVNMAADGTNSATRQDITITTNAKNADGSPAGELVLRMTGERTGECKASDFTPPAEAKAPA
jgi:hypothetical protein